TLLPAILAVVFRLLLAIGCLFIAGRRCVLVIEVVRSRLDGLDFPARLVGTVPAAPTAAATTLAVAVFVGSLSVLGRGLRLRLRFFRFRLVFIVGADGGGGGRCGSLVLRRLGFVVDDRRRDGQGRRLVTFRPLDLRAARNQIMLRADFL